MRQVFGIALIVVGIVSLIKIGFPTPSAAESVGILLGATIFCFLPAFFLLKPKKKKDEQQQHKE